MVAKIVLHEYFAFNPDAKIPDYQTRMGVIPSMACSIR